MSFMNKVDWKLIDENEFVHLVAELLREFGFTGIEVQGAGPDGGLDLFATEPVNFAIGGPTPFRWGIQCIQ
jgi:hypothetical protein